MELAEWAATWANFVGIVRDLLFILLLIAALLVMLMLFMLYRKVAKLLDSAKGVVTSVEEVTETISSTIAGPAAAGSGVAFGAGKVASFLKGFSSRDKRTGEGGKEDGE